MSEKIQDVDWQSGTDFFSFNPKFHKVRESVMKGIRTSTYREIHSATKSI